MKTSARAAIAAAMLALAAGAAQASLLWNWSYDGAGVGASGTFTTGDTADAQGFYAITAITGQRNGVAISGLAPTGVPIPGNEPFAVDNLVSLSGDLLTGDGFGFALADGTYANVFFASFLSTPSPMEFFSAPPFGSPGAGDSELPVTFKAGLATVNPTVPEPAGLALVATALVAAGLVRGRRGGRHGMPLSTNAA